VDEGPDSAVTAPALKVLVVAYEDTEPLSDFLLGQAPLPSQLRHSAPEVIQDPLGGLFHDPDVGPCELP
jgi:hypothetical protein